jgi:hypothetical protein
MGDNEYVQHPSRYSIVVPILLYGSEVWGIEQVQILEKFQLYFSCSLF